MLFPCTIKKLSDGDWLARSLGSEVGNVEITASSRDDALEQLRAEIRYRLELCPCSAVADDYVELNIRDEPATPWKSSVFGGARHRGGGRA